MTGMRAAVVVALAALAAGSNASQSLAMRATLPRGSGR